MWKVLGVIFFLVFYVTYFFKPHPINHEELKLSYLYICLVHAFIPVIWMFLLSQLVKKTIDVSARWMLIHEVFFMMILVFFIGLSHFLVRDLIYENSNNWSLIYLKEEVFNAYQIGFFVSIIVILFNQLKTKKYIDNYHAKNELTIEKNHKKVVQTTSQEIIAERSPFTTHGFVFAKSCGNYTEIYIKKENSVIKILERITLGNLLDDLSKNEAVLRVHKSYIVNLNEVNSVSGNSAGLKLTLKNLPDFTVPVSRSNIENFEKHQVVT